MNTPARDPAAAIQALQSASRYDLALGGVGFIGRFGGLYPIYVRGLAYLAARQPAEAAGEFQRILDHRSIVLVDPLDAMARLQLARALALAGDTVKAKSAYNDLLTLWKNADPDIPVLKEARANTHDCRKRRIPLRESSRVAPVRDRACDSLSLTARKLLILKRRDVRVVEGARWEIALAVCDGVLQISITVAKPTT